RARRAPLAPPAQRRPRGTRASHGAHRRDRRAPGRLAGVVGRPLVADDVVPLAGPHSPGPALGRADHDLLVAGTLALVVLAAAVSRWGLVNGYSLIFVALLFSRPINYVAGLFNMGNPRNVGFVGMFGLREAPTWFERGIELGLYAGIALI